MAKKKSDPKIPRTSKSPLKRVPDLPIPPSPEEWLFSPQIEMHLEYINGQIEIGQAFHSRIQMVLDELGEFGYPKKYIKIGEEQFYKPLEERVYVPRSPEFLEYIDEMSKAISDIYIDFYKCDRDLADQMTQGIINFATRKRPLMDVLKVKSVIESLLRQEINQARRRADAMGISLEDLISGKGKTVTSTKDIENLPLIPVVSKFASSKIPLPDKKNGEPQEYKLTAEDPLYESLSKLSPELQECYTNLPEASRRTLHAQLGKDGSVVNEHILLQILTKFKKASGVNEHEVVYMINEIKSGEIRKQIEARMKEIENAPAGVQEPSAYDEDANIFQFSPIMAYSTISDWVKRSGDASIDKLVEYMPFITSLTPSEKDRLFAEIGQRRTELSKCEPQIYDSGQVNNDGFFVHEIDADYLEEQEGLDELDKQFKLPLDEENARALECRIELAITDVEIEDLEDALIVSSVLASEEKEFLQQLLKKRVIELEV